MINRNRFCFVEGVRAVLSDEHTNFKTYSSSKIDVFQVSFDINDKLYCIEMIQKKFNDFCITYGYNLTEFRTMDITCVACYKYRES